MKEKIIKLNNETFNSLINGKKLEMIENDLRITIYPPHYGLYLTEAQLDEIRKKAIIEGARETFNLISKLVD